MANIKPKADFLIEVSYEAVNLLGGVYAVLATKTKELMNYYGDNYYVVGPYYTKFASSEFEKQTPPHAIQRIFDELKGEGIVCYYGRWLIEGNPKTFLVDFRGRLKKLKEVKANLSKKYKIDLKTYNPSLKKNDDGDINPWDPNVLLAWGDSTAMLLKKLLNSSLFRKKTGVLHFHSDAGKPVYSIIKDINEGECKAGTVITFHSTRLGRTMAINKIDVNNKVKAALKRGKTVGPRKEYKYGGTVISSHQFENLAAKNADVQAAVSEVVGKEAEYIFGRKTDVTTPNGLDLSRFPSLEERAILHYRAKERIYRFLNAYFLPYYSVDVPNSLLFFTSGRYELTTKGYDLLFESLGKLNTVLKKQGYPNHIFVFLFIMTEGKEVNEEILGNMAIYDAIEHLTSQEFPHIEKRVISSLIHGGELNRDSLFDQHFMIESKKLMLKFRKKGGKTPPVCAFKGLDKNDPLLKILMKTGLQNKSDDRIKVIFYPAPVSVADGLLSMEYNEVISGMHLGVFPSVYEPWGYTPLEASAQSVLSITTDAAGFGKFIKDNSDQRKKPGIMVISTENKSRDHIKNELVNLMHWVANLPRKERIEKKLEAHNLASMADWKKFAVHYIKAHNLAVERCIERQKKAKK